MDDFAMDEYGREENKFDLEDDVDETTFIDDDPFDDQLINEEEAVDLSFE